MFSFHVRCLEFGFAGSSRLLVGDAGGEVDVVGEPFDHGAAELHTAEILVDVFGIERTDVAVKTLLVRIQHKKRLEKNNNKDTTYAPATRLFELTTATRGKSEPYRPLVDHNANDE